MSIRNLIYETIHRKMITIMGELIRDLIKEFDPQSSELTTYQNIKLERAIEDIENTLTDYINNNL